MSLLTNQMNKYGIALFVAGVLLAGGFVGPASAITVNLAVEEIDVTMPDGQVVPMWGLGPAGGATVPGPTIRTFSGDSLTINLTNNLPAGREPVSIVITGQTATEGGAMVPVWTDSSSGPRSNFSQRVRSFTHEAAPGGGTATYEWGNLAPGTYLIQSGTHPAVQLPMGVYAALVVDVVAGAQAYPNASTSYASDQVLLFSAVDPALNAAVDGGTYGTPAGPTSTFNYTPRYFLINGAPYAAGSPSVPGGVVGQKLLLRFLNAGLEIYTPQIQDGHLSIIAEDGNPYPYPKAQYSVLLPPGQTKDALLTPAQAGIFPVYDRRLRLTNSAASPGGLLANLEVGFDADNITNLVADFYLNALGRGPDAAGAAFWSAEIQRIVALGIDIREGFIALAKFFFASGEYLALATTDAQYVADLYGTFLGRAPDAAGSAFWQAQVAAMTRGMVLTAFAFSGEFQQRLEALFGPNVTRTENNLVNDFYRGLLNRLPDEGGFGLWVAQMRTAQCAGAQSVRDVSQQIALAFIQSAEYTSRSRSNVEFVEDLYNAFLRRGADLGGFLAWVDLLDTLAMTRQEVLISFVNSPEFQFRVQAVIDQGCLP